MAKKRKSKELASPHVNQSASSNSPVVKRPKIDETLSQSRPQDQVIERRSQIKSPPSTNISTTDRTPHRNHNSGRRLPQHVELLQTPFSNTSQRHVPASGTTATQVENQIPTSGSLKVSTAEASTASQLSRRKRRKQQRDSRPFPSDTQTASEQAPTSYHKSDVNCVKKAADPGTSQPSALTKRQRRELRKLRSLSGASGSAIGTPGIESNTRSAPDQSHDTRLSVSAMQPSASSTRRRRRKERKSLHQSSLVNGETQPLLETPHQPDEFGASQLLDGSQSSRSPIAEVVRPSEDLRRLVSQTTLLRRPVKEWVAELEQDESHLPRVQSDNAKDEGDVQSSSSSAPSSDPGVRISKGPSPLPAPGDSLVIQTEAASPQEPPQSAQMIITQDSPESSEADGSRPSSPASSSSRGQGGKESSFDLQTKVPSQQPQQPIATGISAIKQRLMAARQHSATRTPLSTQRKDSAKANSIPSFQVAKDPEKAFKRFAAFTRGKGADNSGDESEDSESDSNSSSSEEVSDDDAPYSSTINAKQSVQDPSPRQTPDPTTDSIAERAENGLHPMIASETLSGHWGKESLDCADYKGVHTNNEPHYFVMLTTPGRAIQSPSDESTQAIPKVDIISKGEDTCLVVPPFLNQDNPKQHVQAPQNQSKYDEKGDLSLMSPRKLKPVMFASVRILPTSIAKADELKPSLNISNIAHIDDALSIQAIAINEVEAVRVSASGIEMYGECTTHWSGEAQLRDSQGRSTAHSSPLQSDSLHEDHITSRTESVVPGRSAWDVAKDVLPNAREVLQPIKPNGNTLHASSLLSDEDLHRSIRDISKAVFESTHPLPSSITEDF
ncbi:hypothetical protein K431DRAFT_94380 [Polychaeton citri CBS 116435]|uniref:Uncharacterized protein n=1 Tax=Polychaeton citri CBS 116435 TaxID=1314669 RepID=A0A9P4Q5P6_9PEZI|nr:hypothetical protein K431DRAFT_94380 [Polychaeton citri CBS 116435]